MEEAPEGTIFEEREELMVPPFGGNPTLRVAHFLGPSISIGEPFPMLSSPSSPVMPTTAYDLQEPALKVQFKGWQLQQKRWEAWIQSLSPKYQSIWKKAGIYEAIMGSKYYFRKHKELVLGLAEKWCPDTNTFIFPWGEATITLEDMMVLGGFSVLGDSVSCPLVTKQLLATEDKLIEARRRAARLNAVCMTTQVQWLNYFMGSGSELEHLAFLSLWLSKFLFPSKTNYSLEKRVFPIAIHLARGNRIALAPAVLSRIYEDLGSLKLRLMDFSTNIGKVFQVLNLFAPFQMVQLWAWERFPLLRSTPNPISNGEPRSARWHRLKPVRIENIRSSLDSAGECFQWRPYAIYVVNWLFPKFYPDKEQWVLVDSCLDQELESFTRCLRLCNLVGLDCVQQYLPHRVARQFGMDQDIPACVPKHNQKAQIEWNKYNRMIGDAKIYVPPRLMESDVTTQYLNWWKQSMLAQIDPTRCFVRKPRNSARVPRRDLGNREDDHHVSVPPGFAPESHTIEAMASCGGAENSALGSLDRPNNEGIRPPFAVVKTSSGPQWQNISHLESNDGGAGKMEMLENMVQGKGEIGKPEIVTSDAIENEEGHLNDDIVSNKDNNEKNSKFSRYMVRDLELQARISRLEGMVAKLKAEKLNR